MQLNSNSWIIFVSLLPDIYTVIQGLGVCFTITTRTEVVTTRCL